MNNLYIYSTNNKHWVFKDTETLHAALMYFLKVFISTSQQLAVSKLILLLSLKDTQFENPPKRFSLSLNNAEI